MQQVLGKMGLLRKSDGDLRPSIAAMRGNRALVSSQLWLATIANTCFFMLYWVAVWIVWGNDWNELNWFIFKSGTGVWYDIAGTVFKLSLGAFAYTLILLLFSLRIHKQGRPVNLHVCHKVIVCLCSASGLVVLLALLKLWWQQFYLLWIALHAALPVLHLVMVALVSAKSAQIFRAPHHADPVQFKQRQNIRYVVVTLGLALLYIFPFVFTPPPCILPSSTELPAKPLIVAHRGANMIAPENTMLAFTKAVEAGAWALESDVRISLDGELFLMHDNQLLRTTDVASVFPGRCVCGHFSNMSRQ
eukprot:Colp12_sorted_trinity150504_noHs@715